MEIIDILVSRIARHTTITFNTTITRVSQYDKQVLLATNQGYILQTQMVILATPIRNIVQMSFLPKLPADFLQCNTEHDYYVTNFEAQFDQAHWQKNGFCGLVLLHNPHFLCYPAKLHTLRGFIFHDENDGTNTSEYIINRLNVEFGTNMRPLLWHQRTWIQSQIQGTFILPTKLRDSIIFASSEFGFSYRNRMNGAVQAGQNAAILAILMLRPQLFMKEDANILRPVFESGENIGFWRYLLSDVMIYDILFYGLLLTFIISSV